MTVYVQGSQVNAKEDTVLLLVDEVLDDDLSQFGDDLTLSGGGSYEASSSLRGLTGEGGRELYVQATIDPTDTNRVLLIHAKTSDLTSMTYGILIDSGTVYFFQGGSPLWFVSGLTEQGYHFHWSTRNNPDTTGASNALLSEFVVAEAATGDVIDIYQVAHAVPTTDAGWALGVGGHWDGATLQAQPTYPVQSVRIGKAWHTHVEFAEDWLGARSAHGSTLIKTAVLLPVSVDSQLGDMGHWAGSANVGFCAAHSNAMRGRMLSPLVNDVYSAAATHTNAFTPTQRWSPGPDTDNYRFDVTKLRWCQVPVAVTRVHVRIQVQSWVTAGAAVPIGVRVYSINRPWRGVGNTLGGAPTPPLVKKSRTWTLNVNHGASGVGEWLSGTINVAQYNGQSPAWQSTTLLALGLKFDPDSTSANDANARVKIKAWHVRPLLG